MNELYARPFGFNYGPVRVLEAMAVGQAPIPVPEDDLEQLARIVYVACSRIGDYMPHSKDVNELLKWWKDLDRVQAKPLTELLTAAKAAVNSAAKKEEFKQLIRKLLPSL
jgi:hypothetical protein